MFYSRIFNSQAQLSTRDIQKLDFEKVAFDMLPERPIFHTVLWSYIFQKKMRMQT